MSHSVLISIGSNIDREASTLACCQQLQQQFGQIRFSSIYDSPAFGFDGAPFFNLAALLQTDMPLKVLSEGFKALEETLGRLRQAEKFSSRTLDIDILTYDDWVGVHEGIQLPRAEMVEQAYVLLPVAELVPNWRHPQSQESYHDLWQNFAGDRRLVKADWQLPF